MSPSLSDTDSHSHTHYAPHRHTTHSLFHSPPLLYIPLWRETVTPNELSTQCKQDKEATDRIIHFLVLFRASLSGGRSLSVDFLYTVIVIVVIFLDFCDLVILIQDLLRS